MLQRKLLMRTLSVLMSVILCVPAIAVESTAAKLKSKARTAVELQMQADGSIRGKVVDRQGKSLANASVKISNRVGSAAVQTDAQGMFAIQGVGVGEYVIGLGNGTQKVRVWNARTAPPNTAQLALLVVGDAVRGQCCGAACGGCDSCAAPAAPACGAPAPACAAPACGAPAPSCDAPACAAPTCGVPSPVCSPCDSIIPSCDSCGGGGCDSCGSGGGCFGGGGLFGGAGGIGASPLLIGGVVAAAIAIPLAVDDDDDDAS